MHIAGPDDLTTSAATLDNVQFPIVRIQSICVLEANTLLIGNNNIYPGGGGRDLGIADVSEFLRISLDQPLAVAAMPEPETHGLMLCELGAMVGIARRRRGR